MSKLSRFIHFYTDSGNDIDPADAGLPAGYTGVESVSFGGSTYYVTGIHLRGSDTLRFTYKASAACCVIGCYDGSDRDSNYSYYHSSGTGGAYLRYDGETHRPASQNNTKYSVVVTPTGESGIGSSPVTWTEESFESESLMYIGWLPNSTSAKLSGTIYGEIIVDGRAKFIPCKRDSDSKTGYYDTYSKQFYAPA